MSSRSVISSMSPNIDNETLRKIQDILKLSTTANTSENNDDDDIEENKINLKDVTRDITLKANKKVKSKFNSDEDSEKDIVRNQVKPLHKKISTLEEEIEFQNEENDNIRSELRDLQQRIIKLEKSGDSSSKLTDVWQKLDHLEQHLSARIKQVSNIATGHMEHNMELWNSLLSQQNSIVKDQNLMTNLEKSIKNMGEVVHEDLVDGGRSNKTKKESKNKIGNDNNGGTVVKKAIQGVMSMVKRGLNPMSEPKPKHFRHRRGSTSGSDVEEEEEIGNNDVDSLNNTPSLSIKPSTKILPQSSIVQKTKDLALVKSQPQEVFTIGEDTSSNQADISTKKSRSKSPTTKVKKDVSPKKSRSKSPPRVKKDISPKKSRSNSPPRVKNDISPTKSRSNSPRQKMTSEAKNSQSTESISSRTRSKTTATTGSQFNVLPEQPQCIFLSDYDDKNSDDNSDSADDDDINENNPRSLLANKNNRFPFKHQQEEEEELGWGSELSDSDLISDMRENEHLHIQMNGEDILSNNECEMPDNDINQETGPHATLHELILAIGQLTNPTHEILDDIWLKLPVSQGLHYPTKTDIPNTLDRQAELLRVMIVLYENISNIAMQNGNSPDLMYSNGEISNLSIASNNTNFQCEDSFFNESQ